MIPGFTKFRGNPSTSYRQLVINDGAFHAWFLDETTGTVAVDSIGSANGAYVNSPVLAQPGIAGLNSILLNGSSQYLTNSNGLVTTTNFTYELLCKTSVAQGVLFQANDTGNVSPAHYDKMLYLNASGNVIEGVYNAGYQTATSSSAITDGAWHHVIMAMGTSACLFYLDGTLAATLNYVSTDSCNIPVFGAGSLYGWPGAVSSYFSGNIAAPAIYPFAMSAAMAASHASKALG